MNENPSTKTSVKRGSQVRDWKPIFLRTLERTGNVSASARAAKIERNTAYVERNGNLEFAAAWNEALEFGVDELEQTARDRALNSSDLLLIFLLKANRPEKYRENLPNPAGVEAVNSIRDRLARARSSDDSADS